MIIQISITMFLGQWVSSVSFKCRYLLALVVKIIVCNSILEYTCMYVIEFKFPTNKKCAIVRNRAIVSVRERMVTGSVESVLHSMVW